MENGKSKNFWEKLFALQQNDCSCCSTPSEELKAEKVEGPDIQKTENEKNENKKEKPFNPDAVVITHQNKNS